MTIRILNQGMSPHRDAFDWMKGILTGLAERRRK